MSGIVSDTHSLIWYFAQLPQISSLARQRFDNVLASGAGILVPSICVVEVIYLCEKGRLPLKALEDLRQRLATPDSGIVLAPLDASVADSVAKIPRDLVPDMPDRIIAATALSLGLPLVSRDRKIRVSGLDVVW